MPPTVAEEGGVTVVQTWFDLLDVSGGGSGEGGDPRLGTIEPGPPGYTELGRELPDFDLVYGYPWAGEDGIMLDVMRRRGRDGAKLLLNRGSDGIHTYEVKAGELVPV
mgnify:CR=1 FL=1